jgi:hypothetical protein
VDFYVNLFSYIIFAAQHKLRGMGWLCEIGRGERRASCADKGEDDG